MGGAETDVPPPRLLAVALGWVGGGSCRAPGGESCLAGEQPLSRFYSTASFANSQAEGKTKAGKAPILLFSGGCSIFIFPFPGATSTAVLRPRWTNIKL